MCGKWKNLITLTNFHGLRAAKSFWKGYFNTSSAMNCFTPKERHNAH